MYLQTTYSKEEIVNILVEQIDDIPNSFSSNIFLRYRGTSSVCGFVTENIFELSNRQDPFSSLRARGKFIENENSTTIKITWLKPNFISFVIFQRYELDKKVIINFLREWLNTKEILP